MTWLEMEPYTGRTHQLRVHAAYIGCPILGDRNISRPTPTGISREACRTSCICTRGASSFRTPDKGMIDVTAPMPPHMRQSWNLIGFDEASGETSVTATSRCPTTRRGRHLQSPS